MACRVVIGGRAGSAQSSDEQSAPSSAVLAPLADGLVIDTFERSPIDVDLALAQWEGMPRAFGRRVGRRSRSRGRRLSRRRLRRGRRRHVRRSRGADSIRCGRAQAEVAGVAEAISGLAGVRRISGEGTLDGGDVPKVEAARHTWGWVAGPMAPASNNSPTTCATAADRPGGDRRAGAAPEVRGHGVARRPSSVGIRSLTGPAPSLATRACPRRRSPRRHRRRG